MAVSVDGHRMRMRQRAERMTVEAMRSQDIVELLLYYALPRRDTKQQAGELMNRFGDLESLLAADEEALCSVKGVGPRSARWLRTLGELVDAYRDLESEDRPCLSNISRAQKFLGSFFDDAKYPEVWQFHLSASGRLLGSSIVADCAAWGESEYLRGALIGAMESRAHSVLLGQFSPYPYDPVDEYDSELTSRYARTLAAADIQLLDHLIVCPDGRFSLFASGKLGDVRQMSKQNQLRENYLREDPDFDGESFY